MNLHVNITDKSTFDLCASFQTAAFTHVEDRIKTALNYLDNNGVNVSVCIYVCIFMCIYM
jgi:tRNA A37 threonylcarbamoyltransferase TsaD